jgi:uncharacterized membrane protein YoaK (UPF0700 family)
VGVIGTSTTDIHGNEIHTEVITNNLDELMIRVAKHFGHKRMWRVIHWIERRKLRKSHGS